MSVAMRMQLEPAPTSPARARHFVRRALEREGAAASADVTELLTSELVTNAVLYSQGSIELSVSADEDQVLVVVSDGNPAPPRPRSTDVLAASGRGLLLVGELADDWGVNGDRTGKQVWFALRR